MGYKATFRFGGDLIDVIWTEQGLMFLDISSGSITGIQGIRLDKSGVIKEHPDLKNDNDWKNKAIKRLKEHLKKFNTEEKKINYIIEDLKKHGYEPLYKQRHGHRPIKI